VEYHERRHDQMLDLWFEKRTLWSHQEVENLKTAIMCDLEEQIAPCREEEQMPELEPWFPVFSRDIAYARRAMEENHERAEREREWAANEKIAEAKRAARTAREYEEALQAARRLDEVQALELLAYTMVKERGITRKTVRENMDRWASEGFNVPRGSNVEARAVRAKLLIDALRAMDRGEVASDE
jgi:hypothetical protein